MTPDQSWRKGNVFVLRYAGHKLLIADGKCICSTNPSFENEVTLEDFEIALRSQECLMTDVFYVDLPEILPEDDQGFYAILDLAKQMGYFHHHGSIFESFDAARIGIDGDMFSSPFPFNWRSRFAHSIDYFTDEGPDDVLLFISERNLASIEDVSLIKYRISFRDFCDATWIGGNRWSVNTGKETLSIIEFFDC